ncbi:MAG: 2-oxoacid:ferredoxin oxidoreductase subunit beta, partial [Halobacteriovoraceae bacterium]|nr:2-oxoacid:ferredoxin oxidoreductase subunit beta [Halobacteriovoraceae bacterium]
MTQMPSYSKKDFVSNQEVRWCPGCGDYSILAAIQMVMPKIGKKIEDIVFVSGIGCSSRFPYYMNTYGLHTIHGRAPAVASGVKAHNPDLSVWVITGDGDGLSIGGNHLIHALRRNLDINIILFNNKIYGLTKGQYSPTSELGKQTKSSPFGSVDRPFSPDGIALGVGGSFFARTMDNDVKHMQEVFLKAVSHKGTSFVEVYQNCNIFNDKTHDPIINRKVRDQQVVFLEDGKPLLFDQKKKGVVFDGTDLKAVDADKNKEKVLVHQQNKPSLLPSFY